MRGERQGVVDVVGPWADRVEALADAAHGEIGGWDTLVALGYAFGRQAIRIDLTPDGLELLQAALMMDYRRIYEAREKQK